MVVIIKIQLLYHVQILTNLFFNKHLHQWKTVSEMDYDFIVAADFSSDFVPWKIQSTWIMLQKETWKRELKVVVSPMKNKKAEAENVLPL